MRHLKYPAISGLRFYAALIVFVLHLCGAILFHLQIPPEDVSLASPRLTLRAMYFLSDGNHGVDLFFVISGFLMARIVLLRRDFSYLSFVRDRFLRIYPAFFVSLVVTTLYACSLLNMYGWTFDLKRFLGNMLFLNAFPSLAFAPYNSVTWSLAFEFGFYFTVPLLLLLSRIGRHQSAAVLLACYTIMICFTFSQTSVSYGFLRAIALFIGALIGSFSDDRLTNIARRLPTWAVVIAYCSFNTINTLGYMSVFQHEAVLIAGIVLLFIKTVFGGGHSMLTRVASHPVLQFLGEISYSIYLLQIVAMDIALFTILPQLGIENIWASIAALIALSIGLLLTLASISYFVFEAPYFRRRREEPGDPVGLPKGVRRDYEMPA